MDGIFTFIGTVLGHGNGMVIGHLILVSIIALYIAYTASFKMTAVPTGFQNIMEAYLQGILSMGEGIVGRVLSKEYLPLVATVGFFIFLSNLIGIIPGFESPTSNINVTLPLALTIFVYYNYLGIKKNGLIKYFAHFMGPVKALAPLLFPIEIISHISRVISLSFRLFGNIKGDDLFLWVLLMLVPLFAPLPAYLLLTFSAILQTFVFMILIYVYIAGAVLIEENH